jgi:hypothetical protein
MKRMMTIVLAFASLVLAFSNARPAAAWSEQFYDFNYTVDPFQAFADAPGNVDAQTLLLGYDCYRSESLRGALGRPPGQDNGCAMLTNSHGARFVGLLAPLKGSGIEARVEFVARDLKTCGRCAMIVYAGSGKPQGIGSFQKVGEVLSSHWQHYRYQILLDGSNPVVAVGILNLDDRKDRQVAGIDNLRVTFLDD